MDTTIAAPQVQYGGFWRRFVAYLLDGFLVGFLFNVVATVVTAAMAVGDWQNAALLATMGVASLAPVFGVMIALSVLVNLLYFTLLPPLLGGTIGKVALGLAIVDKDMRRISFRRALGRYLAYIPSAVVLLIGFLVIGLSNDKRGWHDRLAGTYVVKREFALPRQRDARDLLTVAVLIPLAAAALGLGTWAATGGLMQAMGAPAITTTADEFLGAMRDENYLRVFDLCTVELQKEVKSADNLKSNFRGLALQTWTISGIDIEGNEAYIAGTGTRSGNRSLTFQVALEKSDPGWKISGFMFR